MEDQLHTAPYFEQNFIRNFCGLAPTDLMMLGRELQLLLTLEALTFCQTYFRNTERRDPTVGELRLLDAYAQYFLIAPETLTIGTPQFTSEEEARVWQDLCRKHAEISKNAKSPKTVSEILLIGGKYLARAGRTCAHELSLVPHQLLAAHGLALTENESSYPIGASLPRHQPVLEHTVLLLLSPREVTRFPKEIHQLFEGHPDALLPLAYIGDEGLLPHLLTDEYGIDLDLLGLARDGSPIDIAALSDIAKGTLLLLAHEQTVPSLFAEGHPLSLLGMLHRDSRLIIRRGASVCVSLQHSFLTCWRQEHTVSLTVPHVTAHTVEMLQVREEGELLIGTVSGTGRSLPAIISLIHALFSRGAQLLESSITAALTLPDATAETVAEALPLLFDYHRAVTELALPCEAASILHRTEAKTPVLTVAIAAKKGTQPVPEASERLFSAISQTDFAALRQVIYEKL